jgi:hypothetical protein
MAPNGSSMAANCGTIRFARRSVHTASSEIFTQRLLAMQSNSCAPSSKGLFSKAEAGAQRAAPLDAKSPDAFQFGRLESPSEPFRVNC